MISERNRQAKLEEQVQAEKLEVDLDADQQLNDQGQDSGDANVELLQQQIETEVNLGVNSGVSASTSARRLVIIQLDSDFDDDVSNDLGKIHVDDALEINAGRGGNINVSDNLEEDGVGALVILAGIEKGKVNIDLDIQVGDDLGDVTVAAANEGSRGNGSGHSHGATGEDREDGRETHSC